MSLTLTQQPTTPNAAYTRLVYVASGSFGFQDLPQFQYLMDIYPSGSFDQVYPDDNRIVRIAQVPNPAGVAVFDPSPVLQGQLEIDNNWKTIGATGPTGSVKSFSLVFGYQYGTSLSSSVEPIQILIAPNLEVFPGIVNENNGQSFNFNTSSYDISQTDRSQYLTNQPSIAVYNPPDRVENMLYMNSTDYFTATQLKDEFGTGSVSVIGQYYDGNSDTFVVQSSFFYEDPGDFITFGFGPQNLSDYSLDWANLIGNGSINHITTISDLGAVDYWIKDNLVSSTTPTGPVPCSDEYTRFAFINQYGFWDYYNVYNPVKTNTDLQRESFSNSFVNYSTNPSPYNVNRRGDTQTYLASTDRYSIDTDYINKETANWLEELMESPSVYLQEGANFVPIIITNTEYQTNNSTARNKLFQYTIEWEYANARRSRI